MKFTFACKKVALNDSIKEYAEKKISKLDRYFPEQPWILERLLSGTTSG